MALTDITLNDGQATPVAHVFTYMATLANNRILRGEMAAPAEEPLTFSTAHTKRVAKGVTIDSHMLRIDETSLDSDGITPHVSNIRLMADVPRPVLSDALADDFAAYIRNWATSANVRAWLRGSHG